MHKAHAGVPDGWLCDVDSKMVPFNATQGHDGDDDSERYKSYRGPGRQAGAAEHAIIDRGMRRRR